MHSELTNLLPSDRRHMLARGYRMRLGVVGIILVTTLIIIAAVLLFPTYMLLTGSMSAKQARLASLETALTSSNGKELTARLTALTNNTATLVTLARTPSVSAIIRSVLDIARPGVSLTGFVYAPATDKTSKGQLTISGTAVTRDALRNYQLALQSAPITQSAALPVSAYAKDSDIAFTIVITLAL